MTTSLGQVLRSIVDQGQDPRAALSAAGWSGLGTDDLRAAVEALAVCQPAPRASALLERLAGGDPYEALSAAAVVAVPDSNDTPVVAGSEPEQSLDFQALEPPGSDGAGLDDLGALPLSGTGIEVGDHAGLDDLWSEPADDGLRFGAGDAPVSHDELAGLDDSHPTTEADAIASTPDDLDELVPLAGPQDEAAPADHEVVSDRADVGPGPEDEEDDVEF